MELFLLNDPTTGAPWTVSWLLRSVGLIITFRCHVSFPILAPCCHNGKYANSSVISLLYCCVAHWLSLSLTNQLEDHHHPNRVVGGRKAEAAEGETIRIPLTGLGRDCHHGQGIMDTQLSGGTCSSIHTVNMQYAKLQIGEYNAEQ